MTQLIDVATTTAEIEQDEPVTVSALLEEAEIDLSRSSDITVRINGKKAKMEDIVNPGDTVLITRNIEGG